MIKVIKYKLYAHDRNNRLHHQIHLAATIYNHCIALHGRYYRLYGKSLDLFKLQKHITKLKKRTPYLHWKNLNSQLIQDITERIDEAYQLFFHNLKHGIKTVTLKRDAVNDLYICFAVEAEDVTPNQVMTSEIAGFDFGVKTFPTGSDGTVIESPQFFRENRKALAKALVTQYDLICFETLNLKAMQTMWGRKISDYGFTEFVTVLKYHRPRAGLVDPTNPTPKGVGLCQLYRLGSDKVHRIRCNPTHCISQHE